MPAPNHFRQLAASLRHEWNERPDNTSLEGAYIENSGNRYWWVYDAHGHEITHWECRPFPGCATLVVTTHIHLADHLRGRGLGTYFHELRQRAYKRAGFAGEVCTVRADSEAQTAIMAKGGTAMGTFPSDQGGTYNVWLCTCVPSDTVQARDFAVPAPVVDTCGTRPPYSAAFCVRPLGHPGEHTTAPTPETPAKLFSHRTPKEKTSV